MARPAGKKHSPPVRHTTARRFDVAAIGASAGGLVALLEVLTPLPRDLPCSILIVQHIDPLHRSMIPEILQRRTALRVKQAEHDEVLLPGTVYVAPPDQHLLAGPGKIQLAHSQLVHFSRPSIDLLFESVAGTYGSRSIGIVLSGTLTDGADGISAIKEAGGVTLAQDPRRAEFKSMPESAIRTGHVDHILALGDIARMLEALVTVNGARP